MTSTNSRPRPVALVALDAAQGPVLTALEQRYPSRQVRVDDADEISAESLATNQVLRGLVRKTKDIGITAWKTYGPDRWAVRANPSSGNLHPTDLETFLAEYDFDASNLNAAREHGLTPLMRAALLGRLDLVEALLERGVDIHRRNADGNTAMWLACVSSQVPVVRRLAGAGIDLNNLNDTGATALMYAASSGKDVMVALLLQLGADPYVCNQDGTKAVDMAASLGALQLLRHTAT